MRKETRHVLIEITGEGGIENEPGYQRLCGEGWKVRVLFLDRQAGHYLALAERERAESIRPVSMHPNIGLSAAALAGSAE